MRQVFLETTLRTDPLAPFQHDLASRPALHARCATQALLENLTVLPA